MDACDESYAYCHRLAQQAASSFYFSFRFLPPAKRDAMCALYAFLRRTDDLVDAEQSVEVRRAALNQWRQSLHRVQQQQFDDPILPALADTMTRYQIPAEYLETVVDGVEMDLDRPRFQSFSELEQYCYRVASVVGFACLHVWGFHGAGALQPAHQCGLAFQMTNILRDVKEDAQAGRVYLPLEDLRRFGCDVDALGSGVCDDAFRQLMRYEVERTEQFYRAAADLNRWVEPDGWRVLGAMTNTYRALLAEIKRRDGDVLSSPVRISRWRKLRIATRWTLLPVRARAAW